MRILLTGHTGFIGRNFIDYFKATQMEWCDELVLAQLPDRRLRVEDEGEVAAFLRQVQPDAIVHLAGRSSVKESAISSGDFVRVNVLGTHNLLAHCPVNCRFVYASSATVYGPSRPVPEGYSVFTESDPASPGSVYAASKLAAEHLVTAYSQLGKVCGVSLRLAAQVGRFSTHGLVHDVLRKLRTDAPTLDLIGDCPGSCKPIMDVWDTCRVIGAALEGELDCGVANVSTCDAITVAEVAEICMSLTGLRKPVRWLGWGANWSGDQTQLRLDNRRVRHFVRSEASGQAVRLAIQEIIAYGDELAE